MAHPSPPDGASTGFSTSSMVAMQDSWCSGGRGSMPEVLSTNHDTKHGTTASSQPADRELGFLSLPSNLVPIVEKESWLLWFFGSLERVLGFAYMERKVAQRE